ncbi:NADH-quinone oxidoreductase subunit K [Cardiobacteriaceae bacterium TAE3-ERU3]|nr:NADH-quinone oxidoreductase subunit K [Cardiobacteriaceae bacterium TAE3-ERU3]
MTLLLVFAFWITLVAAAYLMLCREALRVVIGLMLFGNAVNFALLLAGRLTLLEPAVMEAGAEVLSPSAANPLPQALVLTAIVIGFALTCFAVVLMIELIKRQRSDDVDRWREAEPHSEAAHEPVLARDCSPQRGES